MLIFYLRPKGDIESVPDQIGGRSIGARRRKVIFLAPDSIMLQFAPYDVEMVLGKKRVSAAMSVLTRLTGSKIVSSLERSSDIELLQELLIAKIISKN